MEFFFLSHSFAHKCKHMHCIRPKKKCKISTYHSLPIIMIYFNCTALSSSFFFGVGGGRGGGGGVKGSKCWYVGITRSDVLNKFLLPKQLPLMYNFHKVDDQ